MKKLFLTSAGVIFCILFTSAQNNSQADRNDANTMAVYRAMETGDVSKLDKYIDKNIVDHAGSHDVIGLDSAKMMFIGMHDHISNLKMEPIAHASGGDYYFSMVRLTGTTNSDYMGMPANTPLDMTSVNVVKIKNGKAVEHWGFEDPKDMMKWMEKMQPMQQDHNMMNDMDSTQQKQNQ